MSEQFILETFVVSFALATMLAPALNLLYARATGSEWFNGARWLTTATGLAFLLFRMILRASR